MFQHIEESLRVMCSGPLQVENRELFDTHDNESIFEQLLPSFEEFDRLFEASQVEVKTGAKPEGNELSTKEDKQEDGSEEKLIEEEFEPEEEVVDLVHDDPEQIALALETEEQSDEQERQPMSAYELHRQKLLKLIQQTEQSLMQKKDWRYTGEVTADERPEDALLDDMPDFEVRRKAPLKIDAEINEQIEQLIKLKILDKKFDNPVYTTVAPKEEKEKISFERSKKALTEVIQKDVIGERAELPQAVKNLEEEVLKDMQELEAELRSYFVQYLIVK